jgi:hypothetical protein
MSEEKKTRKTDPGMALVRELRAARKELDQARAKQAKHNDLANELNQTIVELDKKVQLLRRKAEQYL